MKPRLGKYLLTYLVGPHLPEWWASVFCIGYGACLAFMGSQSLSMGLLQGPVQTWFESVTVVFGAVFALVGLVGLEALHQRRRWLRMATSVFAFFAFLWVSIYYLLATPTPWQGVWAYQAHACLEACVFLRIKHNLTSYW